MRARQTHDRYASLTWLIIGMAVGTVTTVALALHYGESRLVASKGESLALAASEIAHKLDLLLAEQYDGTLELSRTHVFRKRDAAAQSAHLATVKKIHPIYLWLGVTDAGGRIVAATNPATIGKDLGGSSLFQAARDTGHVHVGDVEPFVEVGGTDAISFTAPIGGAGGEFQGVVTTRVGLPLLEDVVARTIRTFQTGEKSGGNLEYKFMTATGAVFIDSDLFHKGNVNLKRLGLPSALLSESGQPGYFEEEHLHRHVRVVTGYARTQGAGEFPGLKWTVLLQSDKDNLVAPIRSVLWKLAAVWILVWLPMLGFSLWSAGRLKEEWTHAQDGHALATTAESKYRQLVDQARDIIYRVDDQGRFTFVSPIVTRIMGYSPQELLGRRFIELLRPDARAAAERFYGWQFVRKTPSTYYEFPAIAKDGREVWIGQNVQALLENGQVAGFHAVARDITERKRAEEVLRQSEERFRSAFGHAAIGMALVSTDGRWLQVNPALCDIVGYSEPELLATTFQAITHPDDLDGDLAYVRQMLAGEIRYYQMEKRYLHKRGYSVWILLSVSLVRDAQGNPLHFISLIQDITERKRAEETLQEHAHLASFAAEVSLTLNREASTDEMLRRCTEATVRHLGAALARIWIVGPGDLCQDCFKAAWCADRAQCLHLRASAGLSTNLDGEYRRVPLGALKIGRIAQGMGAMVTNDVLGDERLPDKDWLRENGLQSFAGFPLTIGGQVFGVMAMFAKAPLSEPTRQTLESICNGIAAAIARKQAEADILHSRAFLDSIVENIPNMIFVKDTTDLKFIRLNKAGEELLGYNQRELIGKSDYDFFPKQEADFFTAKDRAVLDSRQLLDIPEEPIETKNLGARILHTRKIPILDKEGQPQYLLGISEDITERKRAEEVLERLVAELAESRNRFEMFFRQTPSAISITTVKEGRFLDVNKQAEVLTGYSREELIGRTTLEMNLYVDPTDRPKLVHELQEKGVITDLERLIRTKSGEIRTAVFSLVPIQIGSEPCLLSIAHDITERKRAERRLRERSRQQAIEAELSLLAATVPDLSSLLDTAVKLASNALEADYCEVLELLPNGSELRLHASAGWKRDRIGQVRAAETGSLAHAALQSNKPVIRALPDNARFGGPPWLHEHGAVGGMNVSIPGKESPWGVLGVYTAGERAFSHDDVNFLQTVSSILATAIERMQAESVLKGANQALRLLSRQLLQVQEDDRRAIARDLHDEIGQSLTAIKLNVERAQRTSDRDARTRIMQDCAQITERVLGQVRDLSLDLHPSILDDLGLAYALRWYADRQAERAGLKVEVTADPSLPRLPQDIEIACFRIAQEALTNVVRHARANQAGVTLKRLAKRVELRIQDDGIGFDVKTVQSPMSGGTSIGLTGMRERARLVGGEVHVTSDPHKGTIITAIVPLPSVPSADTTTPQAPPP